MQQKSPSLLLSLIPMVTLVILLMINVQLFKDGATSGPNQLALIFSGMVCLFIGVFVLKVDYKSIEKRIIHSIGLSMQANLILLVVGALIGLWILSGVVPTMIYYGIQLLQPSFFLPFTLIICAIVSISTGSSWSTGGTVGLALLGIGKALGVEEGLTAGAIISGAYFGDKLSPLSDTTNLAPAMAGTDLFTHIRYMLITTVPSVIIALILFIIVGFFQSHQSSDLGEIQIILKTLDNNFNIHPVLFLLPFLVLLMVAKKVPAFPALFMGAMAGGLMAVVFQQELIQKLVGEQTGFEATYQKIVEVAYSGVKLETGHEMIDKLLSRGGMVGMLNTVWLILMAMVFGGAMEATGMLSKIASSLLKVVSGAGSLITATISSCVVINLTAADQYLALVVPGKMFRASYEKMKLAPENLSRSLEDAGTLTSVLVPWNSCGAYFSGVLGVSTLTYLPFAFFNWINPLVAIVIALVGYKIRYQESFESEESLKA